MSINDGGGVPSPTYSEKLSSMYISRDRIKTFKLFVFLCNALEFEGAKFVMKVHSNYVLFFCDSPILGFLLSLHGGVSPVVLGLSKA